MPASKPRAEREKRAACLGAREAPEGVFLKIYFQKTDWIKVRGETAGGAIKNGFAGGVSVLPV